MEKRYKIENDVIIYYDENGEEFLKEGYFGTIREGYLDINLKQSDIENKIKLEKNIEFGKKLIIKFLLDNMDAIISFTPALSLSMLQVFTPIKCLAEVGDIKNVLELMRDLKVDDVFTQSRKDNYISMIKEFLKTIENN